MIADFVSFSPRNPFAGGYIVLIVTVITWGLSVSGALQPVNGALYDITVDYGPGRTLESDQVLVVMATPPEYQTHPDPWLATLQTLRSMDAKQIIFTFVPDGSTAFYLAARDAGNVIFGRTIKRTPDGENTEPWAGIAQTFDLPFGLVDIPPAVLGVHRSQQAFYSMNGQARAALEMTAARRAQGTQSALPAKPYLVNFRGAPDRVPVVTLQHVLNEGLTPEQVHQRNILIGIRPTEPFLGLHVPVSHASAQMPLTVFQGYALDSLIEDRWIRTLPNWATLLIILIVAGLGVIAYQWTEIPFATGLTVAVVLIYLDIAWLLPGYAFSWPPAAEIITAQVATFLLVMGYKTLGKDQAIRQMQLRTAATPKQQLTPPNFFTDGEPWSKLISSAQSVLDLDRAIILEAMPHDNSVLARAAAGCKLDDIFEQRHDCSRTPYSTAVKENRAFLSKWPLLNPRPKEKQFLAPLNFANKLLGFWAFGVRSEKIKSRTSFLAAVDSFSAEIAQRLYHSRQWRDEPSRSPAKRYLRLEGGESPHSSLGQALEQLLRRADIQEQLLQDLGVGIAFCDLFGDLVQINRPMTELLHRSGFQPTTALELLRALTDHDEVYARELLQQVIFTQEVVTQRVSIPNQDSEYVLSIRVISKTSKLDLQNTDPQPFELRGILFELTDTTGPDNHQASAVEG